MKTTLNISDSVMQAIKQEAAHQGKTMGELIEAALRAALQKKAPEPQLPPLPEFKTGGALVNVANREMLYEVMER